jgi:hypothetical protein
VNQLCFTTCAGLPDGLFSHQISRFGYTLEGLGMENGKKVYFFDHFEHFCGMFYGNLVYFVVNGIFSHFDCLDQEKIWLPWGRCCDWNLQRFLSIFGEKMTFLSKTNVMITFLQKLAVVWAKNANIFAKVWGENIFKNHTIGPWTCVISNDWPAAEV